MHRRLVVAAFALMMLAPAVQAETPYTISGQILDQNGLPVVGAAVYLYQYQYYYEEPTPAGESGSGSSSTEPAPSPGYRNPQYHEAKATTGADGRFSLAAQAGDAQLSASKDGYSSAWQYTSVKGDVTVDMKMHKYPPKTAIITGQFSAGGTPLKYGSISIEYPEFGQYECSTHDEDRSNERPYPVVPKEQNASSTTMSPDSDAPASGMIAPYPYRGCSIYVHADGSFNGTIYPGYAIIRAYADSWRTGGPDYYQFVRTMQIVSGANQIDVNFVAMPGPDSSLSGHVLGPDNKPVVDAWISFYNQESYRGGSGQTDKDGSYKVALRGGMIQVDVWAEGYLPWSGMVSVRGDGTLVVNLTPGNTTYGGYGCCFAKSEMAYAEGQPMPAPSPPASVAGGSAAPTEDSDGGARAGGANSDFKDLGGGLGPYNPAAEGGAPSSDAPGLMVPMLLLALMVLAWRRK